MKDVTPQEGSRRLLVLADYLEKKVGFHSFNMGKWRMKCDQECGTAFCAFGHAANIPEFRELGLNWDEELWPAYEGLKGYQAAILFFGSAKVKDIFNPMSYRTYELEDRQLVISRIKSLAEEMVKV